MPSWTVATILVGVISFFHGTESTVGSISGASDEAKRRYAQESCAFNAKDKTFRALFGDDGRAAAAFAAADAIIAKKKSKTAGAAASAPAPAAASETVFEFEDVSAALEKVKP